MITNTLIFIKTRFDHLHRWPDAPDNGPLSRTPIGFLRDLHRHTFHVELVVEVSDPNRQVEFFDFKELVDEMIEGTKANWETFSCEMMAADIAQALVTVVPDLRSVSVSEEGEYGAHVFLLT